MLTLYWSKNSSAVRALWMLEELGLDFAVKEIDISSPARSDPADFLEASPIGKVPALRDGSELLWGSAPICLYLADKYSAGELAPLPAGSGRAEFLRWMFFTPASVEPAMAEKFMGLEPNKVAAPWGTWDLVVSTLSEALAEREYFVGDAFSAADVMMALTCRFLVQFQLVDPDAAMRAYMERCFTRHAYKRASARDQ